MEKYLLHVLCYSALMYSSLVCSCLFSIIYLTLMFWGGLEPIPADIQREAGSALHRSPVHRKADVQTTITLTFTPTSSLESPINPRVFGLWKEAGALAGSPHRHGENMLKSVFIKLFSALFVLYLLISAAAALSVPLCVCVCMWGCLLVTPWEIWEKLTLYSWLLPPPDAVLIMHILPASAATASCVFLFFSPSLYCEAGPGLYCKCARLLEAESCTARLFADHRMRFHQKAVWKDSGSSVFFKRVPVLFSF